MPFAPLYLKTDNGDITLIVQDNNWALSFEGPMDALTSPIKNVTFGNDLELPYLLVEALKNAIRLKLSLHDFLTMQTQSVTVYITDDPFEAYYKGYNGKYYTTETGLEVPDPKGIVTTGQLFLSPDVSSHLITSQGSFYIISYTASAELYQLTQLDVPSTNLEFHHRILNHPESLDPVILKPYVEFPLVQQRFNNMENLPIGDL